LPPPPMLLPYTTLFRSGAADPTFTYTHSALANGDTDSVFTGALGRLPGSSVGTYAYTLGNLSAGNNYTLSLAPGHTFAITARNLDRKSTRLNSSHVAIS